MSAAPETPGRLDGPHKLGVVVARVFVALSLVYLAAVELTIPSPVLGQWKAAEYVIFTLAVVFGLLFILTKGRGGFIQQAWLTFTTIACLTRGIALQVGDVEYLTFWQQAAGALTWYLVWVGTILSALAFMANEMLSDD